MSCTHNWHDITVNSVVILRFCSECEEVEFNADDGFIGKAKINEIAEPQS